MSEYAVIDECPCPTQLYPFLAKLKAETGCTYASIYRGEDPAAVAILHRYDKHDQAEIYYEYTHGEEPNPANPPGRSTHELKSDGVPYPGPLGRDLDWWQCGIDVDDAHVEAVIVAGAKYSWEIFRPYPTGSEYHHINFRVQPVMPFMSLRHGNHGVRVKLLNLRLAILGYPVKRTSNVFTADTLSDVKHFQVTHHLVDDGVVGDKTWTAIKNAVDHRPTTQHKH